ncbi:MAG TPA: hypothetical protein VJ881_04715 [Halanaerobiales bacterium]|nr:hypothetical protein [Halanaerobiales bacterium]
MNTPKWREPIIDPYSIILNEDLELKSIDGYPHAGNDVFKCSNNWV